MCYSLGRLSNISARFLGSLNMIGLISGCQNKGYDFQNSLSMKSPETKKNVFSVIVMHAIHFDVFWKVSFIRNNLKPFFRLVVRLPSTKKGSVSSMTKIYILKYLVHKNQNISACFFQHLNYEEYLSFNLRSVLSL